VQIPCDSLGVWTIPISAVNNDRARRLDRMRPHDPLRLLQVKAGRKIDRVGQVSAIEILWQSRVNQKSAGLCQLANFVDR
jgi:hypothetical protein